MAERQAARMWHGSFDVAGIVMWLGAPLVITGMPFANFGEHNPYHYLHPIKFSPETELNLIKLFKDLFPTVSDAEAVNWIYNIGTTTVATGALCLFVPFIIGQLMNWTSYRLADQERRDADEEN
jgi:hypothetical protein